MAIIKLGKRIGKDFDLNLNVNRKDISALLTGMDGTGDDIRLTGRPPLNAGVGIMGQFLSHVAEGEGLARAGRYYASFNLPKGMTGEFIAKAGSDEEWEMFGNDDIADERFTTGGVRASKEVTGFASNTQLKDYKAKHGRRVNMFCNSISIPDRTIDMEEIRFGADAPRHFAFDHSYGDLTATFYCDQYLRERSYFELWQKAAFNNASNNYNYHDNYVADMDLFLIGQFNPNNETLVKDVAKDRQDVVYGVKFYDMFPTKIGSPKLTYDNNNIMEFDVTFSYHKWLNYFINDVGSVELHDGKWRQHKQKGEFGFLDFLPRPLRRTGRDALENLRRRLPLGKLFKGRLFPF